MTSAAALRLPAASLRRMLLPLALAMIVLAVIGLIGLTPTFLLPAAEPAPGT